MKTLMPFIRLFRQHVFLLGLGALLAVIALVASISLLALSGWFLSASFLAGLTVITAKTFNFFTPGTGVRGFSILRTASRYFERVVSHDATFRLLAQLRTDCYAKLEPLAPGILQRYRQADLLNRLVADIDTLDHLYLGLMTPFICALLGCLSIVIFSMIWSGTIAITLSVIFIAYLAGLPPLFYWLGNKTGTMISKDTSRLRVRILDYIKGLTDLVISGAEPCYRQKVTSQAEKLYQSEEKMAFYSGLSTAIINTAHGAVVLIVLTLVSYMVYQQQISGPVSAMLTLAVLAIFEALAPLPMAMQMLGKVKTSAARVNDIMSQKSSVAFPETDEDKAAEILNQEHLVSPASIDFINVSYGYSNDDVPVFEKLNLNIFPGEKVAITGHTGCGKSTLLNLLVRADNPDDGQIRINNCLIDQLSEPVLRKSMAVMPQHIHIFSATLRENLQMACPDATDSELYRILESLALITEKDRKDQILDSWVGEGGRALSGGEIRRIGLARVLLQNAPVVVLDEPTEGLDAITETRVLQCLVNYCKDKTLLAVTHKPALLSYVDRQITWDSLCADHYENPPC